MPITLTRNLSTSSRYAFRVTAAAAILIFAAGAQAQSAVVVRNLNDSGAGSLRDAINNATPGETITFQPGVIGTIPLQSTLSICNGQTLTIQGPGASQIIVSGQKSVGVFNICSGANVTISGLTIANGNPGGRGAGINHTGGMLQVRDSVISNNNAGDFGGGINSDSGVVSIVHSTFSSNSAQVGGAVFVSGGVFTATNSTFSGNSAGFNGAIEVLNATASITNSTIAGNSASFANTGGIGGLGASNIVIKGTLLANNFGGNCDGIHSQGYNVADDDNFIGRCTLTDPTDKNNLGAGAGLDPAGLADNGGPTPTIALLPTSPAVDNIPVASCTDTNGSPLTTDQRGISRPQGKGCDSGAYELVQNVPFSSFTAQLFLSTGKTPGFALNADFMLGTTSDGIHPLTDTVTLKIASYTVVIPVGSFHQLWTSPQAPYAFDGTINGTKLGLVILSYGSNKYQLTAAGAPVNFTGVANSVPVSITIGNDAGNASVNAFIFAK